MLCCTRLARLHSTLSHKTQLQRLALPSARPPARRLVVAIAMPSDDPHASQNRRARPDVAKDCLEFINYAWTQFHAVGKYRASAPWPRPPGLPSAGDPATMPMHPHAMTDQTPPCTVRRGGQPSPAGRGLREAVRARSVEPQARRTLLLHAQPVDARRLCCRRRVQAGQRLPHDRRAHGQARGAC